MKKLYVMLTVALVVMLTPTYSLAIYPENYTPDETANNIIRQCVDMIFNTSYTESDGDTFLPKNVENFFIIRYDNAMLYARIHMLYTSFNGGVYRKNIICQASFQSGQVRIKPE